MSTKPLRGKFISPTGALAPEYATAAIQQIMAFVKTIDLEELADFDGDVRVDKYSHLYPEPEELKNFLERAKAFEGKLFKVTEQGYEFGDDGSEEAQNINAFLSDNFRARQDFEEEVVAAHPTALEPDTFFEIEDRLRQKAKQEELDDIIDSYDDDGLLDGGYAGITLVYEGESTNGDKLKEFFSDFELVRAFKNEEPEMWADVEEKIARHADMVPVSVPSQAPANG